MTQSLPTPGQDNGTWGTMLNNFLTVSLNVDGTVASSVIADAQISSSAAINPTKISGTAEVQTNKGAASGYAPLNSSSLVPTTYLGTNTATSSNYLRGDGTWNSPPTASNATTSAPGLVQLAGDLGGVGTTASAPKLSSTSNVQGIIQAVSGYSVVTATYSSIPTLVSGNFVMANASGGAFSITSPSAVTAGTVFWVEKIDSSTNAVTVTGASSSTINGVSSLAISGQWQVYGFVSDGTNWRVFASYSPASDITLDQFGAAANSVNLGTNKLINVQAGVLTSDGVNLGQLPTTTVFNVNSSATTYSPSVGGTYEVTVIGGGGGGGAGGTPSPALLYQMGGLGGGQGESKTQLMTLSTSTTYNILIGAAGAGGSGPTAAGGNSGNAGGSGGSTVFSNGQSTTNNVTTGTAINTLTSLAVASSSGMPTGGGSGYVLTSFGWQAFSYTSISGNSLQGFTYIGSGSSTLTNGATVLVTTVSLMAAGGGGGPGGVTNTIGDSTTAWGGGYGRQFEVNADATTVTFTLELPGWGGGYNTGNQAVPAGGAVGKGAGGGQAGGAAGGTNGGGAGLPGSYTYTQPRLASGASTTTSGVAASNAASTDYGAGGGGGGGVHAATSATGGAGGNGAPGAVIIIGPLV